MDIKQLNQNLSVEQLVCSSFTIKTKIIFLEKDATAIEIEVEVLIHKTITTRFSGFTILTIAHRRNTIMWTRMDEINAEFDSPQNLLLNID